MNNLAAPVPHRDRSTALKFVGILEISLGVVCFLIPHLLMIAGLLVGLGVGTMLKKRWGWILALVVSGGWLILGLLGEVLVASIGLSDSPVSFFGIPTPQDSVRTFMGWVAIVIGLLFIVLPGCLLAFYLNSNVKATFEAKDPGGTPSAPESGFAQDDPSREK